MYHAIQNVFCGGGCFFSQYPSTRAGCLTQSPPHCWSPVSQAAFWGSICAKFCDLHPKLKLCSSLSPDTSAAGKANHEMAVTYLEFYRLALVSSENALLWEMEKKLGYLTLGKTQAPVSAQKRTRSVGRDATVNALPDLHPYL